MFPPKKKPAIGVMIGSAGDSPMPPKYKGAGADDGSGAPPAAAPKPKLEIGIGGPPEAGESPADESGEEYGAKLISDMTTPLIAAGLDDMSAKHTLASIFDAMAKCLRGEGEGDAGAAPPHHMGAGAAAGGGDGTDMGGGGGGY
jgi:hypothetical protein